MFFRSKKEELKKWHMYVLFGVIVFAIGYKLYQRAWPKGTVIIASQEVKVLVASNAAHRLEGWSKKNSMGEYGGMLFVFPYRSQHTMVMRNMRFPLDIVWIDQETIVDIAPNLVPDAAQQESELTPYFARLPSNLVLELPAGFTQKYGVKVGDIVKVNY